MMTKEEVLRRMREEGDKGNLIESGYIAHVESLAPDGASTAQRLCMRHAFFTGVRHTLELVLHANAALGEGVVTEKDCRDLVETLYDELDRFHKTNIDWIMSMVQGVSRH